MKLLRKNSLLSYIIVCVVYIIAAAIGIIITTAMSAPFWVEMLVADLVGMCIIYLAGLIFKNSSMFIPFRSVAPIVTVFVLLFSCRVSFLRFMTLALITVWGVRLTYNWTLRFNNLRQEDWRHKSLRRATGSMFPVFSFAFIYLFQTLVLFVTMLPSVAAFATDSSFSPISIIFFLIAVGAIVLEAYADYHINLFRMDVADGFVDGCCRYGLWGNCRHPNYFGEIVFWWAVYFMVICSVPAKWYLFFGPLINTLVFIMIRVPIAEARNIRKSGYKRYKKDTYSLVPLPHSKSGRR